MASSSASLPSSLAATEWKYDVFLSFRGADTRKGITSDLYHRLRSRGIKTFMDDPDLEVGDAISPTLIEAIEQSRFAVVILSRDYASSTWCLEELAKICECMKDQNRILPLFYSVEPSDVRYRKRSFGEAFDNHESSGRHTSDKVKQWRDALNKVANFSGWETKNFKTDKELVEKIVDFVCERIQPFDTESIMCTEDFEPYEATRKAMGEVMKALEDDNVTAVGVFGMGGVGKTTMVQEVAARFKKNGVFHHVIMAVVSQSSDLRIIQGALADMLSVKLVEETEFGRAARLNREIMRRENILIILDDVWKRIELSTIGIPSHEQLQRCHSKVILTTRRGHVCHDMNCQEKINLDILSEKDSWTLFERSARRSLESTTFEGIAKKVAGECRGLPIALIAVARALGDKDHAEWEKAARRLEKSQSAIVGDEQEAFQCIKFSFDYLKDEDSKSCLLLCCLFPEDHEIKIEDLLRYAVRTRFFRDAETIEDARGELVSIVKYLEDSSLLLDTQKNGCVKMHDVIRDTAIQIAGFQVKVGLGLKCWPRGLDGGCTAISLMRNKIRKLPEEESVCPDLQILILKQNADLDEIPETFVKSLSELRVLDVSWTSISVLPRSFSLLTNLQALYLDNCKKLIDFSVVGKLKKLEILSMREYPPMELPREIGHLTNLRILDVNHYWHDFSTGGRMVTIPSKVISKLHKLEELYMVYCQFEDWGCEVEGRGEETSIGLGELAGLSYLKILQVGIPDVKYIPKTVEAKPDWDYFCITIIKSSDGYDWGDHNSRSLFLNGATISILPDWLTNAMTEKIENLEYESFGGRSDILMEYDHGRLHELKRLRVSGYYFDDNVYLKELMNTTGRVQKGPVFEKLETLRLNHLFHLEELCVGELPHGSLFNLKVLAMYSCIMLKNVSKFVQTLPSLEILDLDEMNELEYVFGCEVSELKESKLREVHLLGPNSVKSICNGPAPHVMFQSIKILTIFRCELLQSLFASDVAQCLFQLEDLLVESCPLLERVIEAVNKEKTTLPKLKNLVLKDLPVLYGASSTVDIECPSLEHSIVVNCPNISFSSSASDYFGSTNPVQLNNQRMHFFYTRIRRYPWP